MTLLQMDAFYILSHVDGDVRHAFLLLDQQLKVYAVSTYWSLKSISIVVSFSHIINL